MVSWSSQCFETAGSSPAWCRKTRKRRHPSRKGANCLPSLMRLSRGGMPAVRKCPKVANLSSSRTALETKPSYICKSKRTVKPSQCSLGRNRGLRESIESRSRRRALSGLWPEQTAMSRYPKVKPGEWVRPIRKGYRMACCDCGLVHELEFKLIPHGKGKKIILRAWRNERATAAVRRNRK